MNNYLIVTHKRTLNAINLQQHRYLYDSFNIDTRPTGHFKDCLQVGFYSFFLEGAGSYQDKLLRVIDKTIYEDIANYYKLNRHRARVVFY